MSAWKYPQEVHEFVRQWHTKLTDKELAAACNEALGTEFTADSMKSFRSNHGYRHGHKRACTGEEYWKYQKRYPQGMYEFIRDNSQGVPSNVMAEMVNEKFGTNWKASGIKQFRKRHGISSGITGRFEKGNVPMSKGKTIEEICKHDPEKIARVKAGQFKKGDKPKNVYPVGTIVLSTDGYLLRKRQPDGSQWERWEFLHRAIWEKANGPIPEGMSVSFKDGDKMNCDISNLMLITKGESAMLTALKLRSEDPDLTETGLNVVRLISAAQNAKKKKKR